MKPIYLSDSVLDACRQYLGFGMIAASLSLAQAETPSPTPLQTTGIPGSPSATTTIITPNSRHLIPSLAE